MQAMDPLEPITNDDGKLIDYLDERVLLEDRPEERVRQRLLRLLHLQYGYPKDRMAREVPIQYGHDVLRDEEGRPVRADVVIYRTSAAKRRADQGQIQLVCETKRPQKNEGYAQLVSYTFLTSTDGSVWCNGDELRVWRRVDNDLLDWPALPMHGEAWDAVGRRKKSQLRPLVDAKTTLRRCHDRIHRRGATDDVALTMVRILLAKWQDEERPGDYTQFYCTPEEYRSPDGRADAAKRAEELFDEVRDDNPTVFDPHERIGGGTDEIVEVMIALQDYRLLGDDDQHWDLMGVAYEQYTADEMKREGGEFFTNRLIVDFLTKMVDPSPAGTMIDIAGGTGGFCSAVLRYARRKIRATTSGKAAQDRAIKKLKDKIFLLEKKPRLVKLAKASMIVSGNGHRGFLQTDSLQPPKTLPTGFRTICPPGTLSLVMTNPPWSGLVNGRITDPMLLEGFQIAHKWEYDGRGRYLPTDVLPLSGVPPEYLFVEQCIKWLKPGSGTLAIVLPKGILDNLEPALAVRHYLFHHCRVRAIINCHKNTFQPYTGSRGCLILATKKERPSDDRDYKIFMAINRKIGQNSEGEPIFKLDDRGRPTKEVDHDLNDILEAWKEFEAGRLDDSEFTFSIGAEELDARTLKANPQFFLPSLNESLKRVVELDGNGFTVERLGDRIAKGNIWKGKWFRHEDLEVESEADATDRYCTPSSILMQGKGVKYLNLKNAPPGRLALAESLRAKEGEILITRSGTIGRVYVVGRSLRGVILSDDLIRVWIDDERLRAFIVAFLRSEAGQDQLRKNEYGTVQQHLEPPHVADLLVPLPDESRSITAIAKQVMAAFEAREQALEAETSADTKIKELLGWKGKRTRVPKSFNPDSK